MRNSMAFRDTAAPQPPPVFRFSLKKLCAVLLLTLLWVARAFPDAQEHKPDHGTVVSQNVSSSPAGTYTSPSGRVTVPLYRRSNLVVAETDNYRYEWRESGNNKPLILSVNGPIEFYRDGDWFIVLDAKHKKHKFELVGMAAKPKETPAPDSKP
jgi:hypothetical protein